MTTPLLNITELVASSTNAYSIANDAFRALEEATQDYFTVDLSSGDVTLTAAQMAADFLFRTSGNTVVRTLTVTTGKRFFAVHNNGTAALIVKNGTGTLVLPAGETSTYYQDGATNNLMVLGSDKNSIAAVEDDAQTAPPAGAVGEVYIPAAIATGVWAGKEDLLAENNGSGTYYFITPYTGQIVREKTSAAWIGWTGTAWEAV